MLNNLNFKYSKRIISNSLTYKVSMTFDLIITLFCLTLVCLYVIGNYQNFQDSTQHIILKMLSYSAIFNTLLSILLLIESIVKVFTEHQKLRKILNILYLSFTIVFSIFCIEVSSIITYLSMGLK